MYKYTKDKADHWELYKLDKAGERQALYEDPEEVGMQLLYEANARMVLMLIKQYVDVDTDELCDLAYRGIYRCYRHYQKHPQKLDRYPFGSSTYLHIKASLIQGVHMLTKGQHDRLIDDVADSDETYSMSWADWDVADVVASYQDKDDRSCLVNSILGCMPIGEARGLTNDTLEEYWCRMDNVIAGLGDRYE